MEHTEETEMTAELIRVRCEDCGEIFAMVYMEYAGADAPLLCWKCAAKEKDDE